MLFTEVILLKAPTRKLVCGSLRGLLHGKAASTRGFTSKDINLKLNVNLPYFDPLLELSVFDALVLMLSLVMSYLLKHVHILKNLI